MEQIREYLSIFSIIKPETRLMRINYLAGRLDDLFFNLQTIYATTPAGLIAKRKTDKITVKQQLDSAIRYQSAQTRNLVQVGLTDNQRRWLRDEIKEAGLEVLRLRGKFRFYSNKSNKNSFDMVAIKENRKIGDFMPTKPAYSYGNRVKYLCPFHTEHTASFVVFLAENSYHCFGCEAHGDIIDLIMRLEGLSFVDACKRLT